MSQSPRGANAVEEQVPFPGHPFGGLTREDRFGGLATIGEPSESHAEAEASSGFDFHLGVYSRF